MTLTQIDPINFIVTPTNQPLHSTNWITEDLGTDNYSITAQTTDAETNRRIYGSDNRGNAHIVTQTTFNQPIVTYIVTLN